MFDDVKALLDAQQADLEDLGLGHDPRARVRFLEAEVPKTAMLPAPGQAASAGLPAPPANGKPSGEPALRPLVGALRKPVPRWKLGSLGEAILDRDVPRGDAYGALDPSALYQSIKRLFVRAAGIHAQTGSGQAHESEVSAFKNASTHWMRHFFATSAANDGVDVLVLKDLMGHASVDTTLLYVHPERRNQVAQMAKLRRRG